MLPAQGTHALRAPPLGPQRPRAPLRRHKVRRSPLAASRSARGKMAIEMVILSSLPRSGTSRTQFCPRVDVSPWRRHSGQYAVTATTTPREDAGKVPQCAQFVHDTSTAQVDRAELQLRVATEINAPTTAPASSRSPNGVGVVLMTSRASEGNGDGRLSANGDDRCGICERKWEVKC